MQLLVWPINNHPVDWWEKNQITKEYQNTTPGPLSARISELYGLDLIEQNKTAKSKQAIKAAFDSPTITYRVNLAKASRVISNGGRLTDNFQVMA